MILDFSSEGDRTLEIFRAGTHTTANGIQLNFTQRHLEEIAEGYDPSHHEAPVVLGHPADNAPAYGWIKGLKVMGDRLYATLHQLSPSFVEAVKSAAYKKVSASFYTPESSVNPKPGRFMLRHLGFLGAQAPAIKGLAPIQFSEEGDEAAQAQQVLDYLDGLAIAFSVAEDEPGIVTFADAVIDEPEIEDEAIEMEDDEDGEDDALGILQQSDSGDAAEDADDDESEEPDDADEDTEMTTDIDLEQRLQELAAREQGIAVREQAIAIQEAAIARQEMSNFLEGLYSNGQLTPGMAQKEDLIEFMLNPEAESLEFSETTQSGLDWFKGFLSRLPKQVSFAELPTAPIATAEPVKGVSWGADQVELHRKITAYAKEHSIEYAEAMTALEIVI